MNNVLFVDLTNRVAPNDAALNGWITIFSQGRTLNEHGPDALGPIRNIKLHTFAPFQGDIAEDREALVKRYKTKIDMVVIGDCANVSDPIHKAFEGARENNATDALTVKYKFVWAMLEYFMSDESMVPVLSYGYGGEIALMAKGNTVVRHGFADEGEHVWEQSLLVDNRIDLFQLAKQTHYRTNVPRTIRIDEVDALSAKRAHYLADASDTFSHPSIHEDWTDTANMSAIAHLADTFEPVAFRIEVKKGANKCHKYVFLIRLQNDIPGTIMYLFLRKHTFEYTPRT